MAVDVSGLERLVRQQAEKTAAGAARELAQDLQASAPVLTGETKAKTTVRRVGASPSTIRYRAEAQTPQAVFTDRGTRPHIIRPRRASVLRFTVAGRVVYARKVNHPGSRKHRGWFSDRVTPLRWAILIGRNLR